MQVLVKCHHKQTNKQTKILYLVSASASTTIIYVEWPRVVITGSPSANISVTSPLSLLTRLQLLSNDIWPREGTQQPGKPKLLKDSSWQLNQCGLGWKWAVSASVLKCLFCFARQAAAASTTVHLSSQFVPFCEVVAVPQCFSLTDSYTLS